MVMLYRHPTKLNVHLVCHTHHDPGWLKTFSQVFCIIYIMYIMHS